MALKSHLETLEHKHDNLDGALSQALAAPSVDDLVINDIKRQKLQIKDEMARIKQQIDE